MATDISTFFGEGSPAIHLFDFVRDTRHWQHTSADRSLVFNGQTFSRANIERSKIVIGQEARKLTITVTVPKQLPLVDNWRPFPPSDPIALTIFMKEAGASEVLVDWTGRVVGCTPKDDTVELSCEPLITRAETDAITEDWQRGCNRILYSQGEGQCNVNPAEHELPAVLDVVDGVTLKSPAYLALPSGRLAGGFVQWVRPDGLSDRRNIEEHVGDTIVLEYGALDLVPGMTVPTYPGCNQSPEDCEYYNNLPNYGGALYMPVRDYYDGNPVI